MKPKFKPGNHLLKAPGPQEINVLLGLFSRQEYAEAAKQAQAMTRRYPQLGFAWKVLGVACKQLGENESALVSLHKAAVLSPEDAEAHYNLGVVLQDADQIGKAETSYRQALAIKPDNADANNNLGRILKDSGRLDEAETCYRIVLKHKPDAAGVLCNLGVTLQALGRLDEAQASCRQALSVDPNLPEAHLNLGVILKMMGRLEEAEASYRKAIQLKPDSAPGHSNLGVILQDIGHLAEAETSYRRALVISPEIAAVHNNLGATLRALGRVDDATASFRTAIRIKPDLAEAWLNLGHSLCDLDDLPQAVSCYQRAIATDPTQNAYVAAVYLAILHYLERNLVACRDQLRESAPILEQATPEHKNSCSYWRYLDKLLIWHQQCPQLNVLSLGANVLYVIGESHSLSAHGMVVRHAQQLLSCQAEWISGCKQWHLGNGLPNRYKHRFEAIMARLPRNSKTLLLIGEIDCRHDEGVLLASHKSPAKSLLEVAHATVDAYVHYVMSIALKYGHRIIIGGVPCTTQIMLDAMEQTVANELVKLIRIFNARLKHQALSAGMEFLDVYALTVAAGANRHEVRRS